MDVRLRHAGHLLHGVGGGPVLEYDDLDHAAVVVAQRRHHAVDRVAHLDEALLRRAREPWARVVILTRREWHHGRAPLATAIEVRDRAPSDRREPGDELADRGALERRGNRVGNDVAGQVLAVLVGDLEAHAPLDVGPVAEYQDREGVGRGAVARAPRLAHVRDQRVVAEALEAGLVEWAERGHEESQSPAGAPG